MRLPGYTLTAELAHSERTVVYQALRERDGTPVVIKLPSREYPSPADLRRLEFEHRILTKVRGPGVVEVLGLEAVGSGLALILEDFGGRPLRSLALPLTVPEFLRIALPLVQALGRIHALRVVHKDLEPNNILVGADGNTVKLIDFQLASEISRERRDISVVSRLEGSLPYISPEQTGRMNRALDYRSDYYSLGVTFFELLTGTLPFAADDAMGFVHCHISKAPPLPHEVNPAVPRMLSRIVHKLLAKEPRERYQSARGLYVDLERAGREHERGASGEVALGSEDVSERLSVSQQLFGRRAELAKLLAVFEAAQAGAGKLLVVSGYAGVGKSSLIRELLEPVTAKHGYFIAGKFTELDKSVPYAAWIEAFRGLVRQILSEPDAQVQAWRERLLERLGAGASLMAQLIPELERVIGPQPAPAPLDPAAARNRFEQVFAEFIQALALPEQPLVLVLDDLQWADAATPDLILHLFANRDVRHLLLIGAYREKEVAAGDALDVAMQRLAHIAPHALERLELGPLDEAALGELVATSLQCSPEACEPLTHAVYEKTRGNPFFASELLLALYRDGAVRFTEGHWTWDLRAVRELAASDNVLELMVRRFEQLSPPTRRALQVAACLGNVFALDALAALLDQSPDATAVLLWEPVGDGLILPLHEDYRLMHTLAGTSHAPASVEVSYRFQHDRVQQAVYSTLSEDERRALHLEIGRRWRVQSETALTPPDVFALANHLNIGRALIEDPAEREALARLDLQAGAKAFSATAFSVALEYHAAGLACFSADEWAARPELHFELAAARASSTLMSGQREQAAALTEELFALAPSKAALGSVYVQKCQVMMYLGDIPGALAAVRAGLALFGIDFPEDHAAIDRGIGSGLGKMQAHMARVPIESLLELPELQDAEKVVAMQLLFLAVPPAIMVHPPLFILAELTMFDLALSHGTTAVSAKNFVDCGLILGGILGDHSAAYRLGKVAFRVLERYAARALECQVNFVFAAYVSSWAAPYREAREAFDAARRLGIETGDYQHFAFSEALRVRMLIHMGRHLDECESEVRTLLATLERMRATIQLDAVRLCQRAVELLSSDPSERSESPASPLTRAIVQSGNAQWAFQHGQIQMLVAVLLGDWDGALAWSQFTRARLVAASTLFILPEYLLCESLIITVKRWPSASVEAREALWAELVGYRDRLASFSARQPENFAHKYELVCAEMARLEGQPLEATLTRYEAAAAATGADFLHWRALSTELAGRCLLERRHRRLGEALLGDALALYTDWGATTKVRRLGRELGELFGRTRTRRSGEYRAVSGKGTNHASSTLHAVSPTALDASSALKASQAISGELEPERLFARLMSVILENAAAERGCLILPEEDTGKLVVRARAAAAEPGAEVSAAHELEREPRVCARIVRYVARSREVIVLDDATTDPLFGREPYLQGNRVKSVLCMPIIGQGRLVAVLYVENNATTEAFSDERVEVLRLIGGQAAISITNALLYETLERKVEERTRELAQKTRTIAAMLDGMQQGVFTLDDSLRIQPEYSQHLERLLGRSDLAGRRVTEVLFAGADLGRDVLATNESALRFSFGATLAIANANAAHLIREYSVTAADGARRSFEVDWSWIRGEAGKVERVLVTLRDVTVLRGLQQAAAQAAREAEMIQEILEAGVEDVKSFCDIARRSLSEYRGGAPRRGSRQERMRGAFRCVHTIKGHARTLGLRAIVAAAHGAEDACAAEDVESELDGAALPRALETLDQLLAQYASVGERKLGQAWAGADERFKRAFSAIEAALLQGEERPSAPARALSAVRRALERANAVPLERLLRESARVFPALADELGKAVPDLDFQDGGTLLEAEWGQVLKDALVHSFKNALDHGIEAPEERAALGKPPRGRVVLRTELHPDEVRIRVRDDGRGLPLEELRSETGQQGCSDDAVAEAIFELGVSTAKRISAVSGRGVGMDAVRGFLRERGGDVHIEFTGAAIGGHRPFELVFRLPREAALQS